MFVLADLTPARVLNLFPGTPVSHISDNLPQVVTALRERSCDRIMALAALGTIRAEVATFRPLAELVSKYNTSPHGRPFDLYDRRHDLGNVESPDGWKYRGRGYVQLTGRFNYQRYGKLLGLTLEDQPDLATDPMNAARLLVFFLEAVEIPLRKAMLAENYAAARKLVNGGSHGLDAFTDAVTRGLQEFQP